MSRFRYGYDPPATSDLTEKEREALELVCDGNSGYQASIALNVDPANISRRLRSARMKLRAGNYLEMAIKFDRMRRPK